MNNRRIIILTILAVLAASLVTVSVLAFAYAGRNTNVTNPSATSSGSNGYTDGYNPYGATTSQYGSMSGMMNDMMGGSGSQYYAGQTPYTAQTSQTPTANPTTAENTVMPMIGVVAVIGAILSGTGGAVYYIVPKTRMAHHGATPTKTTESTTYAPTSTQDASPQEEVTPIASVSKTLTLDEQKVLDVLVAHEGKYLQKYIRTETGLSRLKTHRIVSRLAERDIVTLEKIGNTNEVQISSWLH